MCRLKVLLALALLLPACAPDAPTPLDIPSWAKVAPEQIGEAKKHGVPVAFENELGMRFVLIPAGRFMMGSPEDEEWREIDTESEVSISDPFYIQITEVTNGQYRRWKPTHSSGTDGAHSLNEDLQPVVDVTLSDAISFAVWLTKRSNRWTYALPLEAEWECACRAGSSARFAWGNSSSEGHLHSNALDPRTKRESCYYLRCDTWRQDDGFRVSAPVASYPPNRWGLYDMHGNVWEWCQDLYEEDVVYVKQMRAGGRAHLLDHVIKSGSWTCDPEGVRSATRTGIHAGFKQGDVGFRLTSPIPDKDE